MRAAWLALAFAVGSAAAGALFVLLPRVGRILSDRPPVVLDGVRLPPESALRPFVETVAARVAKREAYFAATDADET
ncbi:MAG TPA: hypothetical protein VGQ57_14810, partial [Polyangiaceae bacterium]|nr:hypothetical protein [Polyangiaceae bacterium]